MKYIIGILIIIASIIASIYLGIWVMFVGGIIDIIREVRATNLDATNVAIGVAKIVFCELSALIAYIGIIIGYLIMGKERKSKKSSFNKKYNFR